MDRPPSSSICLNASTVMPVPDIERLYGYRPWLLETFVDEREHTGASLRAANWVRVGETCGRGRQDVPPPRRARRCMCHEPSNVGLA